MIAIDCTAVEREYARTMYEMSELDYLIFNDPLAYAELILNGDVGQYLRDSGIVDEFFAPTQDDLLCIARVISASVS